MSTEFLQLNGQKQRQILTSTVVEASNDRPILENKRADAEVVKESESGSQRQVVELDQVNIGGGEHQQIARKQEQSPITEVVAAAVVDATGSRYCYPEGCRNKHNNNNNFKTSNREPDQRAELIANRNGNAKTLIRKEDSKKRGRTIRRSRLGEQVGISQTELIDSRSILTNKEKLKRFWEKRMEMEFKLRQQQQAIQLQHSHNNHHHHQQQALGPSETLTMLSEAPLAGVELNNSNGKIFGSCDDGVFHKERDAAKRHHMTGSKSVSFNQDMLLDENNNSVDEGETKFCESIRGNDEGYSDVAILASEQDDLFLLAKSGQHPQADREIRRKETRLASSHDDGQNNTSKTSRTPVQQGDAANAETITMPNEKNDATNGNACDESPKSGEDVSIELLCEEKDEYNHGNHGDAHQDANTSNNTVEINPKGNHIDVITQDGDRKRGKQQQGQQVFNTIEQNGHSIKTDENQLLSIDPTLCHPSSNDLNEPNSSNSSEQQYYSDTDDNQGKTLGKHQNDTDSYDEHEEQICNEEFSSSNSSFGPMSITISRTDTLDASENGSKDQQHPSNYDKSSNNNSASLVTSDEEEQNSTQSGSVLTVITKMDNNQDDDQQQFTSDETLLQEVSTTKNDDDEIVDDNENGSNIGVAFESLHFDNEIKSSKNEQVDEERLIAPCSPSIAKCNAAKRSINISKFDSNEVKSVCNFISNAISDATRQVESFMKSTSNGNPVRGTTHQDEEDNGPVDYYDGQRGLMQRARFVQESSSQEDEQQDLSSVKSLSHNSNQLGFEGSESDVYGSGSGDGDAGYDDGNYIDCENEKEVPKADLSSIFEANVRREIERFESNSMTKKVSGSAGKLDNKNGRTEWRIAEEIRLFNEREKELKQRFETPGSNADNMRQQVAPAVNGDLKLQQQEQQQSRKKQNVSNQLESVVRFGKTLQIPKSSPQSATPNGSRSTQLSKAIKLSTTSSGQDGSQQGGATMISMHKFISSGGTRFVYTNSSANSNSSALKQQNYLTKSMSNLSMTSSVSPLSGNNNLVQSKPADYKAIDSLRTKETPNVKPGLTRKAIEAFSRLNNETSNHGNELTASAFALPCLGQRSTSGSRHQMYQQPYYQPGQSSQSSVNVGISAEWKIQEELREMRAREAELKSLRSQRYNTALASGTSDEKDKRVSRISESMNASNNSVNNTTECSSDVGSRSSNINLAGEPLPGKATRDSDVCYNDEDFLRAGDNNNGLSSSNRYQFHQSARPIITSDSPTEKLSYSSDSLYPIKQTIDTFRKLNSSSGSNPINGVKAIQKHHKNSIRSDQTSPIVRRPI